MWSHSIDHLVKHKMSLTFFLISFEQLIGDIIAKNPLFVLITGDLMLDQQIGGKMIFLRLKVLKSICSLPPMV